MFSENFIRNSLQENVSEQDIYNLNKNTKWIHIDIAGPSYKANDAIKYASPEASGVGVRLLFAYFD